VAQARGGDAEVGGNAGDRLVAASSQLDGPLTELIWTTLWHTDILPRDDPPAQKAAMYRTLGLKLTYHPDTDTLDIEARPDAYTRGRVGGAFNCASTPAVLKGKGLPDRISGLSPWP